jgi:hypothetical protein
LFGELLYRKGCQLTTQTKIARGVSRFGFSRFPSVRVRGPLLSKTRNLPVPAKKPWLSSELRLRTRQLTRKKVTFVGKPLRGCQLGFSTSRPHTRDWAELLNPHFTICLGIVSASVSVVRFLAMPLSKWRSHWARERSGRLGSVSDARKTHERKPHSLAQSIHTYQTASVIGAAKTGVCLA